MLFTPRKYGKDWTRLLATGAYVAAIAFALSSAAATVSHFDNWSDKLFAVFGFLAGAIICAALGKSHWKMASETAEDHPHDH